MLHSCLKPCLKSLMALLCRAKHTPSCGAVRGGSALLGWHPNPGCLPLSGSQGGWTGGSLPAVHHPGQQLAHSTFQLAGVAACHCCCSCTAWVSHTACQSLNSCSPVVPHIVFSWSLLSRTGLPALLLSHTFHLFDHVTMSRRRLTGSISWTSHVHGGVQTIYQMQHYP